jgi:hypothetical protein
VREDGKAFSFATLVEGYRPRLSSSGYRRSLDDCRFASLF